MIQTARLRLLPLTVEQLAQVLEDPGKLETALSVRISRAMVTERMRRAIGMKLEKMALAPRQDHPWYTYWLVVIVEANFGAGLAGYKGIQNGKGVVEIGYGIDPAYQSQGYITETVRALIDWAFSDPECRRVVARETPKSNPASLRVLEKVGMKVYAESGEALWLGIDR